MGEDAPVTLESALATFRAGNVAAAVACTRALLNREPDNADALGLLGLMLLQSGNAAEALEPLNRAVTLRPNAPVLQFLFGSALRAIGRPEEQVIDAFRQAVALQPAYADAHLELGNSLKRLGRLEEAIGSLTEAARLAPRNASAWLNLGVAQLELGSVAAAVRSFRNAVAIDPNRAEAHNVLGSALMEKGDITAAQESFQQALRLAPNLAAAHNNLARTFRAQGRITEAVAEYRAALAISPDAGTHSNLCYALNFIADLAPEEIWREHQAWADRWGGAAAGDDRGKGARTGLDAVGYKAHATRRLRVGFVSPDLVNHAVAYFFEPLLAARDRAAWEAVCYSDAKVPDRVTERLRALSDQWRDTSSLSDDELHAMIWRDEIDVLADLAGHTAHNRLKVFARKPAAIQATWLGYPNTTGLRSIDYRITDTISDPPGQTEHWYSERLLRLPRSFLCYLPPRDAPDVNGLPALANSRVTFASFSNFAKVSPPCLKTWAEILKSVPDSRLIVKSRGLADGATAALIHQQFRHHDIAPERVELDGKLVSVREHLGQYHGVDIALDPFPYHGTTTTCEALWMGVPVVTLAGQTHVSRVGASLLTHLGRPEWIANSVGEYISRAVALASNQSALEELRRNLRAEMHRSPLCDAAGFAADFTAALRQISR